MAAGRIVIVGMGVAGATAAQTLRTDGYEGQISLIGTESGAPYRRTMVSKELLAGTVTEERALLKPERFWVDAEVELCAMRRHCVKVWRERSRC